MIRFLMKKAPHAARAAVLGLVALGVAAACNAANPLGIRWTLSPDGRPGIPRVFEDRLPEANAEEAFALIRSGKVIVIDSRDAKDYQENHIPGAINIPMREWHRAWPRVKHRIPKEATLLLYCYGAKCGLSTRMAKRLLELGYQRPLILERGWKEWVEAGYPTVRPVTSEAPGKKAKER